MSLRAQQSEEDALDKKKREEESKRPYETQVERYVRSTDSKVSWKKAETYEDAAIRMIGDHGVHRGKQVVLNAITDVKAHEENLEEGYYYRTMAVTDLHFTEDGVMSFTGFIARRRRVKPFLLFPMSFLPIRLRLALEEPQGIRPIA